MSSYTPIIGDLGAIFQAKFPHKFVFVLVENWHFRDKATNAACMCVFFSLPNNFVQLKMTVPNSRCFLLCFELY